MCPKVNKLKMNGFKFADETTIEKYVNKKEENSNQILLKVINELASLKIDDNSNIITGKDDKEVIQLETAVKNIFEKPENDISLDFINSMINKERFIRPSLDLVLENTFEKNLKVSFDTNYSIVFKFKTQSFDSIGIRNKSEQQYNGFGYNKYIENFIDSSHEFRLHYR
jgi:hypothetical protein